MVGIWATGKATAISPTSLARPVSWQISAEHTSATSPAVGSFANRLPAGLQNEDTLCQ